MKTKPGDLSTNMRKVLRQLKNGQRLLNETGQKHPYELWPPAATRGRAKPVSGSTVHALYNRGLLSRHGMPGMYAYQLTELGRKAAEAL